METSRGDAAAGTWIFCGDDAAGATWPFRGDESRRRRGWDVDILWRRRRGRDVDISAETRRARARRYGGGGGDPTPAWETLETYAGVAEFVAQDDTEPAIVGFFDEERDADAQTVYQEVADGSRYDFRFALITDEAARTEAKLQKGPAVLVYAPPRFLDKKGGEKKRARYPSAKLDADALKKFITKKSVPLVGQKTWKSGERYEKQGVPVVTLFAAVDLEKNGKGFDYFANRLRKVAVEYVGKLSFNIGDKEDFSYFSPREVRKDGLAADARGLRRG